MAWLDAGHSLSPYALPPYLPTAILRAARVLSPYELAGTDIAERACSLRACYAVCGTGIAYLPRRELRARCLCNLINDRDCSLQQSIIDLAYTRRPRLFAPTVNHRSRLYQ
eukprot:2425847-Rhodomonas_salina.1